MNYGTLVALLTRLLRKDAFIWTEEATKAFEYMRQAMVTLPVLALLDFSLPFMVETDASSYGVEAILSQKNRPVALFSQALSNRVNKTDL